MRHAGVAFVPLVLMIWVQPASGAEWTLSRLVEPPQDAARHRGSPGPASRSNGRLRRATRAALLVGSMGLVGSASASGLDEAEQCSKLEDFAAGVPSGYVFKVPRPGSWRKYYCFGKKHDVHLYPASTAPPKEHTVSYEIRGATYERLCQVPKGYTMTGLASIYGTGPDKFAGKPTASGDPMDPNRMAIATTWLPLGTEVELTLLPQIRETRNTRTGKVDYQMLGQLSDAPRVVVTSIDRGPFVRGNPKVAEQGRVADLAPAVARALGIPLETGLANVMLKVRAAPGNACFVPGGYREAMDTNSPAGPPHKREPLQADQRSGDHAS